MKNIRFIEQVDIISSFSFATKIAEYIKFVSFSGYNFNDEPGYVDYEIYAVNRPLTDLCQPLEYHELLSIGKVPIPAELVEQWLTDDEIIIDYVIEALGLVKSN
jgi:hypothetical protein